MFDLIGLGTQFLPLLTGGAGLLGLASIGFSLLKFGFSPSKFLLIGVAVAALAAVAFHFATVSGLRGDLLEVKEENSVLKLDNQKLADSVESLDRQLALKSQAADLMNQTLADLYAKDEATQAELRAAIAKGKKATTTITKTVRGNKSARQADAVMDAVNRNLRCQMDNVGKRGTCVKGQWRPQ